MGGGRSSDQRFRPRLDSLDDRLVPDAAPIDPPPTDPAATPPDVTTQLYPGSWTSLDGTTTTAENGTWLAVGDQGDVWVVAQVAANPTFMQLGYLAAQQGQPPVGAPPGIGPAMPGQPGPRPPGGPALPAPVIPNTPGNAPGPFGAVGGGLIMPIPAPDPREPFGGAGGGMVVPNPWNYPIQFPIIGVPGQPGGVRWSYDPPREPGGAYGPGHLQIPLPGGGTLDIRYDSERGWLVRSIAYGVTIWVEWSTVRDRLGF